MELEWRVEVPLLTNSQIVLNLLFIIMGLSGGATALLYLTLGADGLLPYINTIILATGGLIVLTFLVVGMALLNKIELCYSIDEAGVNCKLIDPKGAINRLTLALSSLSRKVNLFGSPITSRASVRWSLVQKAVLDNRKKAVTLSDDKRMLVRVYATPQNYMSVAEMVEESLPDVELKRI